MGGRGARSQLGGGGGVGGPPPSDKNAVPKSLEHFDAAQQAYEDRLFDTLTDAEKQYLREQFLKVFESNGFYMNLSLGTLEKVMNSWFKNQFEAKHSGGAMYDPSDLSPANERVKAAMNLFGVDWRSMTAADYEKYGSLQSDDLVKAANAAPDSYGEVMVRFKKKNVWDRTTYFLGDSLGPGISGAVAGKVSRGDFTGLYRGYGGFDARQFLDNVRHAEHLVNDPNDWMRHVRGGAYLELQYHGHLSMSDVESVVFRSSPFSRHAGPPSSALVDRLKKQFGVDVYYYDGLKLKKL